MAGASGDVTSGIGFDAVFAGFCAGFRRGKRGCASWDVASGDGFDAVFAGFCASTKIK